MPRPTPPRKDKNRVPRAKRELPAAPKKEAERVAKVVARAGLGSRREIEDWIAQGRVAVNGEVLQSPAVTVTPDDVITVDGQPLPERERTRLFIYHKPRGVVTTNRDPEGRTTLFEILPEGLPRLVSVGRLDLNSEGLLLLTNDGGLARVLELPETGWLRRYRVRANGEIDQAKLDTLLSGITVEGVEYGPIEAVLDRVQGANAWITVSLREGKNREVRNVLGALGLQVNRLIRTSYGPFQLGEIPEGQVEEVRTRVLRDQIGAEIAAAAGADFEGPVVDHEAQEAPSHGAPRPVLRPAGKRQAAADAAGSFKTPARRGARAPATSEAPVEDVIRPAGPRLRRRRDEERELEARGTVADRKGRSVKVERVVAPKGEAPPRGRAARRTAEEGRAPRRPRDEGDTFGRGGRAPAGKGFSGKGSAGRSSRPRREEDEGTFGRGPRAGGSGERSFRGEGRGQRRERDDFGDRPRTGRALADAERVRRPRREAEGDYAAPSRARRGGWSEGADAEAPRRRPAGAEGRAPRPERSDETFRGARGGAGGKPFHSGERDEGRAEGGKGGRAGGRAGRPSADRGDAPWSGEAKGRGGFGGKGRPQGPRGARRDEVRGFEKRGSQERGSQERGSQERGSEERGSRPGPRAGAGSRFGKPASGGRSEGGGTFGGPGRSERSGKPEGGFGGKTRPGGPRGAGKGAPKGASGEGYKGQSRGPSKGPAKGPAKGPPKGRPGGGKPKGPGGGPRGRR